MTRTTYLPYLLFFSSVALMFPYSVASAQEATTIMEAITGKSLPLILKPSDLSPGFKAVRLKISGSGGGGLMDIFGSMFSSIGSLGNGSSNSTDAESAKVLTLLDVYWTRGDVVKMNGKDFLVTYKWNLDLTQAAPKDDQKDPEKGRSEAVKAMELTLTLVAIDQISTLSPATGITRDGLIDFVKSVDKPPKADERQSEGLSHAKQIGIATMMYTNDYDDLLPYPQSTRAVQYVTYPYLKSLDSWKTLNPLGSEFRFNMSLGGVNMTSIVNPSGTVLFYESKPWPNNSRLVVFADGSVRSVDEAIWSGFEPSLRSNYPKSAKPLPLQYGMDWKPGTH